MKSPHLDGTINYLDKGNQDDQSLQFIDQWSSLTPLPGGQFDLAFNRIPSGSGLGAVYAINSIGHLYEFMPQTGRWVDHVSPGGENLIAATGADGNLLVLGLSPTRAAFLKNWQDRNSGAWNPSGAWSGNNSYAALATGMGVGGILHVFGIDASTERAAIAGTESPAGNWTTVDSTLPGQSLALKAIATGYNIQGRLQVIGLAAVGGRAYHVAKQATSGTWQSANTVLPGQTQNLTSITALSGNNNNLQVLGLGTDGQAYLAGWMDSNSAWHAGFVLPGQTVTLGAIAAVRNPEGQLQVVGLSTGGKAYLVAWQQTNGDWSAGFELPGQIAPTLSITAQIGAGRPQIVGVGVHDGLPYLISWQDSYGNWQPGFKLQSPDMSLSNLMIAPGANGSLQVIGRGTDNAVYRSSYQDSGGNWQSGSSSPLP